MKKITITVPETKGIVRRSFDRILEGEFFLVLNLKELPDLQEILEKYSDDYKVPVFLKTSDGVVFNGKNRLTGVNNDFFEKSELLLVSLPDTF